MVAVSESHPLSEATVISSLQSFTAGFRTQ